MLLSMTGYGEARYQSDKLNLSIELQSLNNRHLKLIVRAPEPYNLLEPEFEKIVRAVIRRGTVQLHLHCKDDGVGITADNLQRVFDKGFSTKCRDTNYGIGLHWCANAIGALGGRIWAASEGPGLGASMHLMLPLPARERRSSI